MHQEPSGNPTRFENPLPGGRITSRFGERIDPFTRQPHHHKGIDIAAPLGTEIVAPASGTVKAATEGYEGGESYGRVVVIDHGDGIWTLFSKLDSIAVENCQQVASGDVIGTVGSSGQSMGPHLHFEVRQEGEPVDPELFVPSLNP